MLITSWSRPSVLNLVSATIQTKRRSGLFSLLDLRSVLGFFPQRQTYLPLEFVALIFLCTVWHSAISLHKYAEISVLASTYVEALTITPYIE